MPTPTGLQQTQLTLPSCEGTHLRGTTSPVLQPGTVIPAEPVTSRFYHSPVAAPPLRKVGRTRRSQLLSLST